MQILVNLAVLFLPKITNWHVFFCHPVLGTENNGHLYTVCFLNNPRFSQQTDLAFICAKAADHF